MEARGASSSETSSGGWWQGSVAKQIGKKLGATTAPFQNVKSTKTSTDVDFEATVTIDGVVRMIWSPATPCQSAC